MLARLRASSGGMEKIARRCRRRCCTRESIPRFQFISRAGPASGARRRAASSRAALVQRSCSCRRAGGRGERLELELEPYNVAGEPNPGKQGRAETQKTPDEFPPSLPRALFFHLARNRASINERLFSRSQQRRGPRRALALRREQSGKPASAALILLQDKCPADQLSPAHTHTHSGSNKLAISDKNDCPLFKAHLSRMQHRSGACPRRGAAALLAGTLGYARAAGCSMRNILKQQIERTSLFNRLSNWRP